MSRYFIASFALTLALTAGCAAETEEGDAAGASKGRADMSTGGGFGTGGFGVATGGASTGGGASEGAQAGTGGASTGGSTPLELIGDPPAPSQHPANASGP